MSFVDALGRSQAITTAITGIQGIQQNELAIQNTKMQTAINEHAYKKIQEEDAAANRLIPVDPILNQLPPSVKKFWQETGQPYFQQGASGGNYVKAKDMDAIRKMMQDETFNIQSDKLFLEDLNSQEQEIQGKIKQMSQPDAEGKAPKVDEKTAQTLQQQLADIQKKKVMVDQSLDVFGRRKKEREDFTLQQGEKRFSGTGTEIATGGVKPTDMPAGIDEFETVSGINPALRGTPEYKKEYVGFLKAKDAATTKPADTTDKEDKAYSRILAQSNSDAWRRTQAKYPKSGMSFNFTTGEMTTGGDGNPAALDFYEQERNKAVTARLKKVGLYDKYGDLHTTQPSGQMDAMPDAKQNKGKTVKDTETGKRYKSDGTKWVEIK